MFGTTQLSLKNFWRFFLGFILFISTSKALGYQKAPDDLVEKFAEIQQLNVISFLEGNLENYDAVYKCLDDASTCSKAKVISSTMEGDVELSFDQQGLVEFIQERHKELRFLIGIHSYRAITAGLRLGRGQTAISPVKGSGSFIFNNKSDAGAEEWQRITEMWENEVYTIDDFNIFLSEANLSVEEASHNKMRDLIESQIMTMQMNYPFLRRLPRIKPNRSDILKAVKKVKKSFIKSLTHVARLKGNDRYELFGFAATLEPSFDALTDEERDAIEEHFLYIEENTTVWSQIVDVVTSRYFRFMLVCFTASLIIPPVAILCGAVGIGFAIPGILGVIKQVDRLIDFNNTGKYDREIFTKYMFGAFLTAGMYVVWGRAAIPGFYKNIKHAKRRSLKVIAKLRLNRGTPVNMAKDFLVGEINILKDYIKYYMKDFGSDTAVDLMLTQAGNAGLRAIMPNIQMAFRQTLVRVSARNPSLFLYSDLLKVTMKAF